jgi:hypothetical protein
MPTINSNQAHTGTSLAFVNASGNKIMASAAAKAGRRINNPSERGE